MKLFRFFKGHIPAVILCAALLVIQAALELSLPNYMSDIVDVGLQQGGIESPVPKTIRQSELETLESFMSADDSNAVNSVYGAPDSNGIRTFIGTDSQAAPDGEISHILERPENVVLAMEDGEGSDTPLLDEDATDSSMLFQRAIEFVKREYQAQGIDLVAIQNNYLMYVAGIMFALCLGTLITTICVGLTASRTAATIARDTRKKLFNRVMKFSAGEVDRFSQASLITRTTNDVQQIQMACVMCLRMVMFAPIMGIVAFIQVTATHTGMEWIIGVALIAICAVMGILLGVTMPKFKMMQTLVDRLNLVSRDMLDGIMPIRAFGRESYELERFDAASSDLMHTQLFVNRAMTFMMPLIMLIMNLITLLIVWVGSQGIATGDIQVGTMMAFITYTMQIVMSFMALGMIAVMLPRAQVSAERVTEVIECPLSIVSAKHPKSITSENANGSVVFDNVTFKYPDAERPVLNDISFSIHSGKTLGIIGSTGSGKSTLVKLIPRLYDASDGVVSVDGVNVADLDLGELRRRIGFVPQLGFLFSGTIESNIKFADEEMPDSRMLEAANIAQATEFIEREPEKFQTPIAQKGSNVSGGQRQRLSIARALAADPEILIFDDSFSALDYATDAKLRTALKTISDDKAIIIVAQRVATIMQADEILVLENGNMVGRGNHRELLHSCETYREIALSQLSASELGIDDVALEQGNLAGVYQDKTARKEGECRQVAEDAMKGGVNR